MKALFWLTAGGLLGVFGYRYYEANGGRLPILEQLTGKRTDELVNQAQDAARSMQQKGQEAVNDQIGNVTRQTVAAVATEIADAEKAKKREEARGMS